MQIQADLQFIKEDINAVERHRIELYRARERYSGKLRMLNEDPSAKTVWPSLIDKRNGGIKSSLPSAQGQGWLGSSSSQSRSTDAKALVSTQIVQRKDASSGSELAHGSQSGVSVAQKRRIHAQVSARLIFIYSRCGTAIKEFK